MTSEQVGSRAAVGRPAGLRAPSELATRSLARLVDGLVCAPVLVHGSLPGHGRDLDLLVRAPEETALVEGLSAHGFLRAGCQQARFRCGSVEMAEVIPAAYWCLPALELDDMFAMALPIAGLSHLVRPAPEHVLLILARRVVEGGGKLDCKRRSYLEAALAEDGRAWEKAALRCGAWGGPGALALLERLAGHGRVRVAERARVIDERLRSTGRPPMAATREILRQLLPRPRWVTVVALSGLDGSGKSTQAELLAAALERAGVPAVVEWAKLAQGPLLWRAAVAGKAAVARFKGAPLHRADANSDGRGEVAAETLLAEGKRIRESSRALTGTWAAVVAVSNGWAHRRRKLLRSLSGGGVVICDRYVLDSAVHLRWRYGSRSGLGLQIWAMRRLSPRPTFSYFLELDAVSAERRKAEDPVELLDLHAGLYGELAGRYGVKVLDATRPAEDLASEIASEVWLGIAARGAGVSG
ncbi:MAG: dTMP kinase [Acidimicrobiales bacterium]